MDNLKCIDCPECVGGIVEREIYDTEIMEYTDTFEDCDNCGGSGQIEAMPEEIRTSIPPLNSRGKFK